MPAIILPCGSGQPTTPAKINWSHPYSAGLTYAGDLRGSHVHDIVSGKVDTSIFATNPKQAQRFGPVSGVVSGAYNAASTGGRAFYGPGIKLAPIESTHLIVMRVDGVAGAYGGILSASDSTGTDTYWALQDSGSGSQINLWTTNSLSSNFQTLAQMTDGAVHAWAIAKDTAGNNNRVFRDGVFRTVFGGALTSYSPPANAKINYFGARDGSSAYGSYGLIALHLIWNRQLADSVLADLTRNPWQLFSKPKIYFLPSAGGGGATGTLAATESGSDTASIAGDVLVQGALASTESGSDTAALAGDVLVIGSFAVTEAGPDAAAFTGTASVTHSGNLAATESGSDTAAVTGLVLVQGTLAATESGADTAAFTGDASSAVVGSIGATETGSDTAAVTGLVLIQGGLTATESGSDTASVTGLVLIQGGLSATESGSDTALISGTSAIIGTGTLAAVEGGTDTAAIGGVVRISGAIAAAESSSDTASLAGVVPISGMLEATEAGSDTADISSFRPTVPGIEYTLPQGKAHYTLPDGRAHFTIAA